MQKEEIPSIHQEHQVDRYLVKHALDLLEASRTPRDEPVPLKEGLELPEVMPESGIEAKKMLDELASSVLETSAQLHHPGFMAHMDPPTPSVAWVASFWQAALNQNLLHPDVAPKARFLSERLVSWIAPFFGMDGGHFVPGSTVSNLTALWAAREIKGVKKVAASKMAHLSVRKAADILGLEYLAMDSDQLHQWHPAPDSDWSDTAIFLTAGTVVTGAIDHLKSLPSAPWVHVDAAWAGPLRFSNQYASLLDGVENADSVGFSAHKWMYQPKGAALVLFRDSETAHQAMSYGGGYLSAPNIGLIGSAPASALPLAATLLHWGRSGLSDHLNADMKNGEKLVSLIEEHPVNTSFNWKTIATTFNERSMDQIRSILHYFNKTNCMPDTENSILLKKVGKEPATLNDLSMFLNPTDHANLSMTAKNVTLRTITEEKESTSYCSIQ